MYPKENELDKLKSFLRELSENDLVALGTYDEASRNLDDEVKNIIADLGSRHFQNIGFRFAKIFAMTGFLRRSEIFAEVWEN